MLYEICACQRTGSCALQETINPSLKILLFQDNSWSEEFCPAKHGGQNFDPKKIPSFLITVPKTYTVKIW